MENPTNKKKIVIVDDDLYVQELLKYIVARENCGEIILANNGAEALKIIQQELPDLVFIDIMLPHVDGIEICRRLRAEEITSRIPLVLMTSSRKLDSLTREETGADYLVEKPFNLSLLQSILDKTLRGN
jgi:two-component system alkaline phosphatase synthesis response regulator PhoP